MSRLIGLALLLLAFGVEAAPATSEPDLLAPELAFKFSARIKDDKGIELTYDIAPGYYMYRERFRFEIDGVPVSRPLIPKGRNKFDKTFNRTMETHRGTLLVRLPLTAKAGAAGQALTLVATSQGCADAGVCYPPQMQTVKLASGASTAETAPATISSAPARNLPSALAKPSATGFVRVATVEDVEARVKSVGKVTLLDFYADWCAPCKQMEKLTLADPRVKARLAQFSALQADVTRNTLDDKLLLKRFKLVGPPGIVFFDAAGKEIPGLRVIGFEAPEKFLATLERALKS